MRGGLGFGRMANRGDHAIVEKTCFDGMDVVTDSPLPAGFPTTRWSRVARAAEPDGSKAEVAVAELCRAYWFPVYAFIRRKGNDPDCAADLAQDFFARLLGQGTLAAADPFKGRFRTFLLTDCAFFLADRRDHDAAQKRGGGRTILSIDARDAEGGFQHDPAHNETPERLFEKDWAHALIGLVLERLERSYSETGRAEIFRGLRPILTSDPDATGYVSLAADLGMTEGSLRVAVHRLRTRFAVELRQEIATTLRDPSPDTIDDELRDLFAALSS
jgi:DNA-directed RNA polymerase specialized sigma24 family protein